MTILVGNLSSQVTEANLRELFRKFGRVEKIDIFPGAGFATVAIEGEASEERAVQELNGVEKFGQKLELFKSDNSRDGGGGSDPGQLSSNSRDGGGGP
jgi:RNA recognition motif-containing protein